MEVKFASVCYLLLIIVAAAKHSYYINMESPSCAPVES